MIFTNKEIVLYKYNSLDSTISFMERKIKNFLFNVIKIISFPFPNLFFILEKECLKIYSLTDDNILAHYFNSTGKIINKKKNKINLKI